MSLIISLKTKTKSDQSEKTTNQKLLNIEGASGDGNDHHEEMN